MQSCDIYLVWFLHRHMSCNWRNDAVYYGISYFRPKVDLFCIICKKPSVWYNGCWHCLGISLQKFRIYYNFVFQNKQLLSNYNLHVFGCNQHADRCWIWNLGFKPHTHTAQHTSNFISLPLKHVQHNFTFHSKNWIHSLF